MKNMRSVDFDEELRLERFSDEHYEEYKSWFGNQRLMETLGGIDSEWLDYVLKDQEGIEYALLSGESLLGVVGIVLPKKSCPSFVISNIAVHPNHKRRGIGSILLKKLFLLHPSVDQLQWLAFVKKSNKEAQKFFLINDWKISASIPSKDDYIRFIKG